MRSKLQQEKSQEDGGPARSRQQDAPPAVIEAVKHTRYKVARMYGRLTIAEHEYFYVRAQDILVRSDIFHAHQKEGFQRFLSAAVGDAMEAENP